MPNVTRIKAIEIPSRNVYTNNTTRNQNFKQIPVTVRWVFGGGPQKRLRYESCSTPSGAHSDSLVFKWGVDENVCFQTFVKKSLKLATSTVGFDKPNKIKISTQMFYFPSLLRPQSNIMVIQSIRIPASSAKVAFQIPWQGQVRNATSWYCALVVP